jgi:hypothetical protein
VRDGTGQPFHGRTPFGHGVERVAPAVGALLTAAEQGSGELSGAPELLIFSRA